MSLLYPLLLRNLEFVVGRPIVSGNTLELPMSKVSCDRVTALSSFAQVHFVKFSKFKLSLAEAGVPSGLLADIR